MFNLEERITELQNKVKSNGNEGVAVILKGNLETSIIAAIAKKAFPNNVLTVMVNIDSTQNKWRNGLRIIEMIQPQDDIRVDLQEEFDTAVKKIFEKKDVYQSPEVYENYLKTGEAPIDNSYLEEKNYPKWRKGIRCKWRTSALVAWAAKKNYYVFEYLDNVKEEDLVKIAKELDIPEMVIKTNEDK